MMRAEFGSDRREPAPRAGRLRPNDAVATPTVRRARQADQLVSGPAHASDGARPPDSRDGQRARVRNAARAL